MSNHGVWLVIGALCLVGGCGDDDGGNVPGDAGGSPDAAEAAVPEGPHDGRTLAGSATHSCAIRKAGLYCWGANVEGALGDESTTDSERPVAATVAGRAIVEVAATTGRTCVRRASGEVACWGGNTFGELGDGTRTSSLRAVAPRGIEDARGLAMDSQSTCVILAANRGVACWGESPVSAPESGHLEPEAIPELSSVVELRAGSYSTYCARTEDGAVKCWRFGDGVWTVPAEVPSLAGARSIAVTSYDTVCAVPESGLILCHNLAEDSTVTLERSDATVEIVGTGGLGTCGRDVAGVWRCWNVPVTPLLSAVEIRSDIRMLELTMSGFRGCGVREDRSVICLNANDLGFVTGSVDASDVVPGLPL
jgi:hypothetical protein